MLEQFTPFRLCSSQPSYKSQNVLTQRRWKFTPRNNPQPRRVRHFNGINNMPICYVRESVSKSRVSSFDEQDHPALMRANTFTGLPMFKYRSIPYKEKAIPKMGLVPIQEPWRRELHALTECIVAPILEGLGKSEDISKIVECHPYPICRPITSWKNSEIINIKNKDCIFPSRERLKTPKFTPVPVRSDEMPRFDESFTDDLESQVFALLGQVLQCRDIESIQFWLATASDREKGSVMTILQTALEGKMKREISFEDKKDNTLKMAIEDERQSPLDTKDNDEYTEDIDRLLIHSRHSTRTELSRPKTQASKIRPQTSNSFLSLDNSMLTRKSQTAPVYLRYKTFMGTKSVQTDNDVLNESLDENLGEELQKNYFD